MKKGQSEMVGFALILIIIAVLILVFISISHNKSNNDEFIENYEVESFIQATLDYTTKCADGYEPKYADVRRVISKCISKTQCSNGINPCTELNETLTRIVNLSWNVGEDWEAKGYVLNITSKGEEVFSLEKGNKTESSIGSLQNYDGGLDIIFQVFT